MSERCYSYDVIQGPVKEDEVDYHFYSTRLISVQCLDCHTELEPGRNYQIRAIGNEGVGPRSSA